MGWTSDPELQQLFQAELDERLGRLHEGVAALRSGLPSSEVLAVMVREGHTIKGTGRVMGFDAVARGGEALELVWRDVQSGDLDPSASLADVIQAVLDAMSASVTGAHAELEEAVSQLEAARVTPAPSGDEIVVEVATDPDDLDPTMSPDVASGFPDPEPTEPEASRARPSAEAIADARAKLSHSMMSSSRDRHTPLGEPAPEEDDASPFDSELGGLLGALEDWAAGETISVNAGRLFRLINNVAAIRVDTEAIRKQSMEALKEADGRGDDAELLRLARSIAELREATNALEDAALELAAVPLSSITNALPQLVRYLSKKTHKEIRIEIVGDDLMIDRQILERIADPIRQIVVNSIEHGIEPSSRRVELGKPATGTIGLRAAIKDNHLELAISDDGAGIDWGAVERVATRQGLIEEGAVPTEESLRSLLFTPGFSTALTPSELVGDGSGLTHVVTAIEGLYGGLKLETEENGGTRFVIRVPTSRALQRAVLVEAAGQVWGVPEAALEAVIPISDLHVLDNSRRQEVEWRGQRMLFAEFAAAVGMAEPNPLTDAVILTGPLGSLALVVSRVLGSREVAAKELGPLLAGPAHLTGAALLGGGEVVLLVDAGRLAERVKQVTEDVSPEIVVLVVDDSQGARQVVAGALVSNGFTAITAPSVDEALAVLSHRDVDAIVVDYAMPEADGIALLAEVREQYGDIPTVMLSGVATPADQERARRVGVDAFFDKSDFREGGLADSLRSLVASRRARTEALETTS